MKKTVWILTILSCVVVLTGTTSLELKNKQGNDFRKEKNITSVPDRILVKYKKQADLSIQAAVKALIEASHGIQEKRYFSFIEVYVYKTYWGKEETLAELNRNPYVEYAEPDYIIQADSTIPNDPLFSNLWGLDNTGQTGGSTNADIDAVEAWDLSTGSSSVVVAVVDTGIDYNHEDLSPNMWTNPGETHGNSIDDDGNGYVDDYYGFNAVNDSGDPMDDESHGTHVSGTIGARGNNEIGIAGVCWNVKIMALKCLDNQGSGSISDEIKCIEYAIDKGAHIINASFGDYASSVSEKNAIGKAKDAGILFVAAAGNDGTDNDADPHYPSSYTLDNIIAVAASTHKDKLASFSNYGLNSVDVAAPGASIQSSTPNNNYKTWSGTSMATPHVVGLAALIKSHNSSLTWKEIKDLILNSVDQIASLDGKILAGGRINAYNSLSAQQTYTLEIKALTGGTTEPAPGTHTYDSGTDVIIKAIPNTYYKFTGWTGDIPSGHKDDNPITITLNSNKSVTATFEPITFTISGSVNLGLSSGEIKALTEGSKMGKNRVSEKSKKNTLINLRSFAEYGFPVVNENVAQGLSGVLMSGLPGNPTTDASGNYSVKVVYGWTGTVTPTKQHYTFTPSSISYTSVTSDKLSQDFTATRIIYAPLHFTGEKVLNRSLSQAEYINVLNWEANPDNVNIVKYRIYQIEENGQSLLIELDSGVLEYLDRKREKEKSYSYSLVAVNDKGREGNPASLIVQ